MTRRPPAVRSAREGYSADNKMASTLILANIAIHGGEQALPVVWARLIQTKMVRTIKGPLFGSRAA